MIGLFRSVKKLLNSETPALVLTAEGIQLGNEKTRRYLPWQKIAGVTLVIKTTRENMRVAETLHIETADEANHPSVEHIDVHGLDRDSHEIARLVMQRVLRWNPDAKVQVKEVTSNRGWKDLLLGRF